MTPSVRSSSSIVSEHKALLAGVDASERQKIAHQQIEPTGVFCQAAERLLIFLGRAWTLEGKLDLGGQRGQWRAELMRGVRRESPLPLQRAVDAIEHAVERRGQTSNLVRTCDRYRCALKRHLRRCDPRFARSDRSG